MKLMVTLCLKLQPQISVTRAAQIAALLEKLASEMLTRQAVPGLLVKNGDDQMLLVSAEASV